MALRFIIVIRLPDNLLHNTEEITLHYSPSVYFDNIPAKLLRLAQNELTYPKYQFDKQLHINEYLSGPAQVCGAESLI